MKAIKSTCNDLSDSTAYREGALFVAGISGQMLLANNDQRRTLAGFWWTVLCNRLPVFYFAIAGHYHLQAR